MTLTVSRRVQATCAKSPEAREWLRALPELINDLARRWQLRLGAAFVGEEVGCAWLAPAAFRDGTPAVLKLALPHFEGEHEIAGLRFWNGDPTVQPQSTRSDLCRGC